MKTYPIEDLTECRSFDSLQFEIIENIANHFGDSVVRRNKSRLDLSHISDESDPNRFTTITVTVDECQSERYSHTSNLVRDEKTQDVYIVRNGIDITINWPACGSKSVFDYSNDMLTFWYVVQCYCRSFENKIKTKELWHTREEEIAQEKKQLNQQIQSALCKEIAPHISHMRFDAKKTITPSEEFMKQVELHDFDVVELKITLGRTMKYFKVVWVDPNHRTQFLLHRYA